MMRRPRWARCISVGVVMTAVGVVPVAARTPKAPSGPPPRMVQVGYGESVWTLARRYGDPHQDVRRLVARILLVNRVQPGALQPGQRLAIPNDCLPAVSKD